MPQAEFLNAANQPEQEEAMALQVITVDLGENNLGKIGPQDAEQSARFSAANADPQYEALPTRRIICVDGRGSQDEIDNVDAETNYADIQIPGGEAVVATGNV